ncbi:hypothetical protein KY321_04225 [Candidatus Woesearchaeota archaeon]|nr:hypothetical protein [Candidatus Woesearchaeota archaeon]
MAKFEEALQRNYGRKFVCKICKAVIKGNTLKMLDGKLKCRACGSKKLRTPRKK